MRLNEILRDLEKTVSCDASKIEVSGIEFDLNQDLNGKLVVLFENSLAKFKTTLEKLEKSKVSAIIVNETLNTSIPCVKVNDVRKAFSKISSNFYDNPEDKMRIIFVTGTNGKTSTTKIISEILNCGGIKTGTIGTMGSDLVQVHWNTELTTPDPNVLFKTLDEMQKLGCECVVMEASSHALYLEKLYSLYAEVGVLTNCSRDHLDFFKTEQRYQDAKFKMFDKNLIKYAVVNGDDILGKRIIENCPLPIVRYGANQSYEISFSNLTYNNKTEFDVCYGDESHHVTTDLIGEFNVYNIMAGIATARLLKVSDEAIYYAIKNMKVVGGRFEKIYNELDINIVIDFAHTPSSVENVIKTARNIDKTARIITVIGCGGDRDRGKRGIMGQIAGELSDYVVVTTDNPRTEDPVQIMNDIERGIDKNSCSYVVIASRKLAIQKAISLAEKGDFVLILGKGKEDYIDIDGVKYPYSDYTSVNEILEKLRTK